MGGGIGHIFAKILIFFVFLQFLSKHTAMARHNDTGKLGETLAQEYLRKKGFAIVETNWRKGKYEADIIAYKEGLIVFAEVKTRSSQEYGMPEDFVDREKQRAYVRMANNYVIEHDREEEVRFDIITVYMGSNDYRIEHLEGAFSPIGLYL